MSEKRCPKCGNMAVQRKAEPPSARGSDGAPAWSPSIPILKCPLGHTWGTTPRPTVKARSKTARKSKPPMTPQQVQQQAPPVRAVRAAAPVPQPPIVTPIVRSAPLSGPCGKKPKP